MTRVKRAQAMRFVVSAVAAAAVTGCGARTGLVVPEPVVPENLPPTCSGGRLPLLTFMTSASDTEIRLLSVTYAMNVLCTSAVSKDTRRISYFDPSVEGIHEPGGLALRPPVDSTGIGQHFEPDRSYSRSLESFTLRSVLRARWCIRYTVRFEVGGEVRTLSRALAVDRSSPQPIIFFLNRATAGDVLLSPPTPFFDDCPHPTSF